MRLRVPTEIWAASLLAALGVAPVACGGRAERGDDEGGEGATGGTTGGTRATGGTSGKNGTGGSSAGRGGTEPGTGGSDGGRGGSTAGTGAITGNPSPCESPTPIVDESSGFVQCENGFKARPFVAECPSPLPRAAPVPNYDPAVDSCQYDSDCTDAAHGYCGSASSESGPAGYHICTYGCVTDSECGASQICLCGDPAGYCVESTCLSDADCETGLHCASYDFSRGCNIVAFACQTSADTCVSNADCGAGVCELTSTGRRACGDWSCVIGRPFLVDEVARMAGVAGRTDWLGEPVHPDLNGLDPALRERLAASFLRAARLEHASIAAFGRFLLELLAFGAPAELVTLTVQAMDDERRHAELCFALASSYAGLPLGPAELDMNGALPMPTLERSLSTAIREGCVGETVAALEAAELGERVADPVLRVVLRRIAADEKRHAELAFRFVKWALLQGGEAARAIVVAEIARVRNELTSTAARIDDEPASAELARSGVLSDDLARSVRAAALESAVLPGLESLIESVSTLRAA